MTKRLILLLFFLFVLESTVAQDSAELDVITLDNIEHLTEIAVLGRGWVNNIEWSPSSEQLAVLTATGVYIHGDIDFTAPPEHIKIIENALWNSGEQIFEPDDYELVYPEHIVVSLDGSLQARDTGEGVIVVSSTNTGESVAEKQIGTGAKRLLFSNDGNHIIVVTWTSEWGTTVFNWNIITDQLAMLSYSSYGSPYMSNIAISFDDTLLAVADLDNHIRIFNLSNMELVHDLRYTGVAHALSFSPDSRTLVSGSETFVRMTEPGWDNSILVWDTATYAYEYELNGHHSRVRGLDFSSDGRYLLSVADWYDNALLWNFANREIIASQSPTEIPFEDGFFIPEQNQIGLHFLTTNAVQAWTVDDVDTSDFRPIPTGLVARSANISNDGRTFAVTDVDTHIYNNIGLSSFEWTEQPVFDFSDAETLPGTEYSTSTSIAFNPSDTLLAVGRILDERGFVEVWSLENVEQELSITVHEDTTVFGNNWIWVAYSPDGNILIAGGSDQMIAIDSRSHEVITRLSVSGEASITSMAFSPNGKLIAIGTEDGTIRLWGVRESAE